jgi:hypothetical protein
MNTTISSSSYRPMLTSVAFRGRYDVSVQDPRGTLKAPKPSNIRRFTGEVLSALKEHGILSANDVPSARVIPMKSQAGPYLRILTGHDTDDGNAIKEQLTLPAQSFWLVEKRKPTKAGNTPVATKRTRLGRSPINLDALTGRYAVWEILNPGVRRCPAVTHPPPASPMNH